MWLCLHNKIQPSHAIDTNVACELQIAIKLFKYLCCVTFILLLILNFCENQGTERELVALHDRGVRCRTQYLS